MKRTKERPKRIWELSPDSAERKIIEERLFWEKCSWILTVGTEPCPHCGERLNKGSFKNMEVIMKEESEKFNPDLQPKSHVLRVSYWVGKKEDPNWDFDEQVKKNFKELGFYFCGSGFDFKERRRDIEFYRKEKNDG